MTTSVGRLAPTTGPRSLYEKPDCWYMYVLKCRDTTYYCGIARNPQERLKQHNAGKGSKYVRSRLPAKLVHTEFYNSKGEALRAEAAFKKLSRPMKMKHIGVIP